MRAIVRISLSMALLLAGAVMLACNDGEDSNSLDAYFEKLEEIDDRFQERNAALDRRAEELAERDIDGASDLFDELIDLFEEFVNELEGLDPPDEAEDAHNKAVENFNQAVDDFNEALDNVGDADTVEEFVDAVFGTVESEAIQAADAACLELEEIADDNGITLDLDCEEE